MHACNSRIIVNATIAGLQKNCTIKRLSWYQTVMQNRSLLFAAYLAIFLLDFERKILALF